MRRSRACAGLAAGLALVLAAGSIAEAQQQAYPTKGQSQSQQKKDKAACSKLARKQSGYDPAHPPVAVKAEAAPVTGSGARARGAAGGAIVGAIGGNAGGGAALGAVAGGLHRRIRGNNEAEEQNQASAQHIAGMRDSYYRTRGACLEDRGYSVE
jgi:hypothetical protein